MDYKSKIILISGPTASGKSKIAINLAKKIDGEIINADSMQVYDNGSRIIFGGSAKMIIEKNKRNAPHQNQLAKSSPPKTSS